MVSVLVVGAVVLGLVVVLVGVRMVRDRQHAALGTSLVGSARPIEGPVDLSSELAGLPDPVWRYFETVLADGQPYVRSAVLHQTGEFRMDEDGSWHPFTATQWVAVDPPGFVWDATIEMAPFVSARVVDAYHHGTGFLRARLLGLVTVAEPEPGPDLDEGELMRYLAEAVWVPTALLPASGVAWRSVDDHTAAAKLSHAGTTVSLLFSFDEQGLVERVSTDARPRDVDGTAVPTPWTGTFEDYERRDGMLVPTAGEVAWSLSEGEHPYWRGSIDRFEYSMPDERTG